MKMKYFINSMFVRIHSENQLNNFVFIEVFLIKSRNCDKMDFKFFSINTYGAVNEVRILF